MEQKLNLINDLLEKHEEYIRESDIYENTIDDDGLPKTIKKEIIKHQKKQMKLIKKEMKIIMNKIIF